MSFRDLDIKLSYISYGEEGIAKSFLVPALKKAKVYQRSVGFFSSGVFAPIIDGIVALSRNGGQIQLIASPKLSEEDIQAIQLGYQKRQEIVSNAFTKQQFFPQQQSLSLRKSDLSLHSVKNLRSEKSIFSPSLLTLALLSLSSSLAILLLSLWKTSKTSWLQL